MGLTSKERGMVVCISFMVIVFPYLAWIVLRRWYGNHDEKLEESACNNNDEEDLPKKRKDPPATVVGETRSSGDDVEASLTSPTVDSDIEAQSKEKRIGSKVSYDNSTGSSRASHDTSVSQNATTVDVHDCHSTTCKVCRQKSAGVTFVSVKPLEPKMVGKLRTGPPRWYEIGQSFVDLYQEANRPDRPSRHTTNDDENSTARSMFSRVSKGSKKKRSSKKVSSDGDENYC
jgi:hypothetical protein